MRDYKILKQFLLCLNRKNRKIYESISPILSLKASVLSKYLESPESPVIFGFAISSLNYHALRILGGFHVLRFEK